LSSPKVNHTNILFCRHEQGELFPGQLPPAGRGGPGDISEAAPAK